MAFSLPSPLSDLKVPIVKYSLSLINLAVNYTGGGEGGVLKREGGLNNFLPLKRGGGGGLLETGAYLRRGVVHRGFTVIQCQSVSNGIITSPEIRDI